MERKLSMQVSLKILNSGLILKTFTHVFNPFNSFHAFLLSADFFQNDLF